MSAPTTRRRPSVAVVLAMLALVIAAGPPAYSAVASRLGANTVGTAQLKNSSMTSIKVKNGTLTTSDLASSARAQRVVVGNIDSGDRGYQDPIPAGGVVGSLGGRYGSGKLRMPAAGRLVVNGYVILNNTNANVRSTSCSVLVDGTKAGGSGVIYMPGTYSTSFGVEAVASVKAGSHDVAVQCDATDAYFVNMRVDVVGITS